LDLLLAAFLPMGYWREELKDDPELYRAYANLLDASVNNIPAFEREVCRQDLWEEYQLWRKARGAENGNVKASKAKVVFAAGKKIVSVVTFLFKSKEHG
jgi:hypothetical protein